MPAGGSRPGPKQGTKHAMTMLAQAEAKLAGILPHEWLLKVMRGDAILQRYTVEVRDKRNKVIGHEVKEQEVYPDLQMRHDAAKAAAPYFAPKISSIEILTGVSENELDRIIARLATEAGLGDGLSPALKDALTGPPRDAGDASSPLRRTVVGARSKP